MLVRGAIVGLLLGLIHRWMTRRVLNLWMLAYYVWITMWSYHMIRNTTFTLVSWSVFHFLAPILLLIFVHYLLKAALSRLPIVVRRATSE